jgi:hypothetical protein
MKVVLIKIVWWIVFCTLIYTVFGCKSAEHYPRYKRDLDIYKPKKSVRKTTDLKIMALILGGVIWWSNDIGFYQHVK